MNKLAIMRVSCVVVAVWVTPLYANTAAIIASTAASNHPRHVDIDPWVL
jgi:hypothetical protein